MTSTTYQTDPDPKWDASLAALPPWKCGRLDISTWLTEPVQAGRVLSDVVKYVYFEGGEEVIVVGKHADSIAYAAAQYRRLAAEVARLSKPSPAVARLVEACRDLRAFREGADGANLNGTTLLGPLWLALAAVEKEIGQ